jgi:hypothetical protein
MAEQAESALRQLKTRSHVPKQSIETACSVGLEKVRKCPIDLLCCLYRQ